MSPSTTDCVIPKQVLEAAGGQIFMSSLNAFGSELNVVHPPRPSDVRVEWKQEYAVKVRTRSTTSILPMMAGAGSSDRDDRPSRDRRSGPSGFRGFFGR